MKFSQKILKKLGIASELDILEMQKKIGELDRQTKEFDSVDLSVGLSEKLGKLGENTKVFAPINLSNPENIFIGKNVHISSYCWLSAITKYNSQEFSPKLTIDNGTYVGHYVEIGCSNKVHIGKDCLIADHVFIADTDHIYENIKEHISNKVTENKAVIIGDNVWIGDGAKVLPGTEIGDRCVIGAGTVVRGKIQSYSVVSGIPGKVIKRYNKKTGDWEKVL
jgi:acetyltransferase-like isoleucine patch superfamily enzyme